MGKKYLFEDLFVAKGIGLPSKKTITELQKMHEARHIRLRLELAPDRACCTGNPKRN